MNVLLSSKKNLFRLSNRSYVSLIYKQKYGASYLQKLYEFSKQGKTPFFKVDSHHIRIIQDPLDFYLSLKKGIQSSTYRIGLSCLYLGTGTLERYLLRQLKKRQQIFKDIDITMVFDYNRSRREEKGESSTQMLFHWKESLPPGNVTVAFNKNSGNLGVLGEIIGVHHQKMAIFDDKIIIGGANMSQSYFLNRKDRYLEFNQSEQMSSYLFEYLKTLAQNSYQLQGFEKLKKKSDNLKQHYKLWQIAFRPSEFKETVSEQQSYLDEIQKQIQAEQARNIDIQQVKKKELQLLNRNEQIAKEIGTSIKVREQVDQIQYKQKIQSVRRKQKLSQNSVFLELEENNLLETSLNLYKTHIVMKINWPKEGKKFMFFHLQAFLLKKMHYPSLKIMNEPLLFNEILKIANKNGNDIKISSGYLNLTQKILKILSTQQDEKTKNKVQILCSAPQANSFYEGGTFKKYIPFFYRCFQIEIFKKFNAHNKFSIFEYNKNGEIFVILDEWTFHSKGVWIKESQNSYLTVVGSSNYNWRSEKGDTELQLYLYSTCQKFNKRLQKQYEHMKQNCHQVDLKKLQNDEQIKCSPWVKLMSKIFKRFL